MRRALGAALLLVGAAAAIAAPFQEVRLRSGESLRVRSADLRDGRWHLVLPSGLTMSVQQTRVLDVRPLADDEARRAARPAGLVFQSESDGAEPRPLRAEDVGGDAELFRAVEALRAERRSAEAEGLLRAELVRRPGDALRLVLLGRVLVDEGRFGEALEPLGLARPEPSSWLRRERDLAQAEALSRLDRVADALRLLSGTPEDAAGEVAAMRARLESDREAGAELGSVSTPRFVVRVPTGAERLDLKPLLRHLDEAWAELAAKLGGEPRERVVVLVQPGDAFWETTGMGRNVGGLYDGKVRVPAGRLDPPSPRLAAVLRHELAHAFVDALTLGRADAVWQEGIAEHVEGSEPIPALERRLAQAWRAGAWPPAYDHPTAHSRLEWFRSRWGDAGLRDLLREWARRGTIDAATNLVTGLDAGELEDAWGRALAEKWER